MSASPDADRWIVDEWHAALADADAREDEFHLITCPGAPVTGYPKAASFRPGHVLDGHEAEGGLVVATDKLEEANDPAVLWRHRIAIFEDIDPADAVELGFIAGVMRHEIEHAKQRMTADEAFDLQDIVEAVVDIASHGDLERFRELINSSPLEADANGAAAAYLRERYPSAIPGLLAGSDKHLARATEPGAGPETLVRRTIDFLLDFAEICNSELGRPPGMSFAGLLDEQAPGAGELWLARDHLPSASSPHSPRCRRE